WERVASVASRVRAVGGTFRSRFRGCALAALETLLFVMVLLCGGVAGRASAATVEAHAVYTAASKRSAPAASDIVFWLSPLSQAEIEQAQAGLLKLPRHFELVQSRKTFIPHLLIVPAGSWVAFPNRDPFFHNVFSLFEGKRFDLGLYETGATRSVRFDRPGISFIFCNIHPQMSAVVIALKTPYYGVTNAAGRVRIAGVPGGKYRLQIWSERALPETLKHLSREVVVGESASNLGSFTIAASRDLLADHKNLYGRDYDPVAPSAVPYVP
ncbi:MAG: hypothetical protein ACRD2G_02600, partial [Terriglobia bacterium]